MVGLPRFRPSPQSTHSCRAEQRTEDTVTEHTPQTTSNFTPCFRYRLTSPVFAAHTVGALHIRPALLPAAGPSMCVTLSERRVHVIAPHSIRHGTSRPGSGSSLSPPAHHDSPLPRSSHIIIKHTLCHWSSTGRALAKFGKLSVVGQKKRLLLPLEIRVDGRLIRVSLEGR